MKKLLTLIMLFSVAGMLVFFGSCQHENLDPCKDITVEITVTTKNASAKNDGSIAASATGGKDFQFQLNDGAFQDNGNFNGLAAGEYKLTARNSYGCSATITVKVEQANLCAGVTIAVTATKKDPASGKSDGSISAAATGGSGFTFSLNNGAFQSSGTFSNLAAGTYTITAKNANGCTGTKQVTLAGVDACAGITVAVTTTKKDPTSGKSDGSITASATGGSGFTFSLNNGAYQSSGNFTNLAAGTYTITAKNANGCKGSVNVTLATATNACSGVTIKVTATKTDPTNGANGSINASATGSTGLTYSLNNSTYQANGSFSGLAAGTYTVTAKNANGCTGSANITLTAANTDPCAGKTITLTSAVIGASKCGTNTSNGSITITASGSTGFTYNINGGAYQSGNSFNNLAPGTYTIGANDAAGCAKTASVTVDNMVAGPLFLEVKNIMLTKCGTCHTTSSSGGVNFTNDCEIVSRWSRIQTTTTNGSMPPGTPLTAAEKLKIANWVNAGHTYDK